MAEKNQSSRVKSTPEQIARKLSILIEINQAVSRKLNLEDSLIATLQILAVSYKIKSGAVFLFDEDESILNMVASIGYKKEIAKVAYRPGEGLTGKIAETGKPLVVAQVSKEQLFLNRQSVLDPAIDKEQTFIGIPIILDYKVLGVLITNLPFNPRRDYDSTKKFLTLVASALLQPIRFQHQIDQERQRLESENISLKQQLQQEHSLNNVVGNSQEMREIFDLVFQVSNSTTTVIVRGESGTGKELIAQAIHYNSPRKDKPFVRVNCAAVPENLIESEFFGYEKGAFTGAVSRKIGRFELANQGTIFLDEIGNLSPMTQTKLLRVLQEQEFERVGGTQTIKVDVRVIAATNANLEDLMKSGDFREDLYYRLNVFALFLPPLRDRKTDLLLLADHFMIKYGRQQGKVVKRISTPAIDMLMRYHWPGNVRELENCIERAVLLCQDHVIHSYHLPPTLQTAESSNTIPHQSLEQAVIFYEKELIQDALKTTKGNQAKAARLLDTTERILGYKIKRYEINPTRFKTLGS
jgi:Nif-specific regulatory protein